MNPVNYTDVMNNLPQCEVMCMSGLNRSMMFAVIGFAIAYLIAKTAGAERIFKEKTGEDLDLGFLFAAGTIAFAASMIVFSYVSVV